MLQERKVYLGGPITGLSYDEARHGWREDFVQALRQMGKRYDHIQCYSPMRAKNHLSELTSISGREDSCDNFMSSSRGIVCRDRNDVKTADAIVFNFLGATNASVGSCIEVGWADAFQKPSVLILEQNGIIVTGGGRDNVHNPHEHLMIDDICGYRVNNLTDAVFAIAHLLTPGI